MFRTCWGPSLPLSLDVDVVPPEPPKCLLPSGLFLGRISCGSRWYNTHTDTMKMGWWTSKLTSKENVRKQKRKKKKKNPPD